MTVSQLANRAKTRFAGQRARKEEDKLERRRALLAAAAAVFARHGWSGFTMADVAERAGVVKGTLYLYFTTKEELLLALLEALLDGWLDELDARLRDATTTPSARKLAALFADSLLAHASVPRLLAVLQTVLEHNVARASIERFKRFLMTRLAATGTLLEARLPPLRAGEGVRLLLHLNALVSGLQQMAETAPLVREVLADPALAPLAVDFGRELRHALETFFVGLEARGRK
jgi:AcrR family transcriptional regulator